jgi:hypothetical protein
MEVQNPNRLSMQIWWLLVIVGAVCLIIGWYRWFA